MTKAMLGMLAASILACGLPRESWADDEAEYAQREQASPELGDFRGGHGPSGFGLVIILILSPVLLPIYGIYALGEWLVDICVPDPPPKPAEEPKNPCSSMP